MLRSYCKTWGATAFLMLFILGVASTAVIAAPLDISSLVTVSKSERSITDRRTLVVTTTSTITITNSSPQTISAPFNAVFEISSPEVQMPGAIQLGAANPYGKFYYDLSNLIPSAGLSPSASITFTGTFTCKSSIRYTYNVLSYGSIAVVPPGNQIPTANAGQPQTITLQPGQTTANVTLAGSGNDPDGTIASYTWTGTPDPADVAGPTVSLGVGSHTFTLIATDNQGATSAPATVTITVIPAANQPPVIRTTNADLPGPLLDTPYTGIIDAYDPDGSIASFELLGTAPTGMTITSYGSLVWTPGFAEIEKPYAFSVRVTDNQGATAATPYTVKLPDTLPPVVIISAQKKVVSGNNYFVQATATDNVAVSSFNLKIDGQTPAWTCVNNGCTASLPAGSAAVGSTIALEAVATDAAGNIGSASASVTVVDALDTTPPAVRLDAPPRAYSGTSIKLTATPVSDGNGIYKYLFYRTDGAVPVLIGEGSPLNPTIQYVVPVVALNTTNPVMTAAALDYQSHLIVSDALISFKTLVADGEPVNLTFSVTATDAAERTAEATAQTAVVIPPADTTPPVINLETPASLELGKNITINLRVTDDDLVAGGDIFLAHQNVRSYLKSIDPMQSIELPVPAGLVAGMQMLVRVEAVDASGNRSFSEKTVTLTPQIIPNAAPAVSIMPVSPVTMPAVATLIATVTDDGQPQTTPTLTWSRISGPGSVVFGIADAATTTVTFSSPGIYILKLEAFDGALTGSANVTVIVNPTVNRPPVLSPIGAKNGSENALLTFIVSAIDADSDPLTYTAIGLPVGSIFDPVTRTFSWTPGYDQAGSYSVIFTVSDGALSSTETVTISIANTNRAPVIQQVGPIGGPVGIALTFTLSGSDPDNDILVYSVTPLPTGAAFDAATRIFSWTPSADQAGTHSIPCTVSDGSLTASINVTVNVGIANRAPQLTPIGNKTVAENSLLTFTVSGSDPDGDTLTYSASTPLPSSASFDTSAKSFSWTPSFSQAGSYKVSFTVSDGSASDTKTADITVTDVNRAPVITTLTLPKPRVDSPYGAIVTASDPDGDDLTFTLGSGAPAAMTIGASTGALSWTPAITDIGSSYTFTAAVSDGRGGSDSRSYTLGMDDTIAPVVQMNAPKEIIPGAMFIINATASDNIAVTGLGFVVVSGITVETGTASVTCQAIDNCQFQVTTPRDLALGSIIVIGAEAQDAAGNKGQKNVEIRIAAAPDTQPPMVSLSAPLSVVPGQAITLAATATDNVGIAGLAFNVAGATVGTVTPPVNMIGHTVPADAVIGSKIPFTVTATDFSDLTATATAESTVVETPDTEPPVITLNVPATVVAGRNLPVGLKVTDDRGVVRVEVKLAHQQVAAFSAAVDQVLQLPVTADTEAGTRLVIEVAVVDAAGNSAVASAVSIVEVLQGLVTGAVYDDTTGAPLPGAEVTLKITGRADLTATTDDRGHYSFATDEGTGRITVTKSGYSRVDRPNTAIVINAGRRVHDARLTPLAAAAPAIPAVLGGSLVSSFATSGGGVSSAVQGPAAPDAKASLAVPAGALAVDTQLQFTQIGTQGLQGYLPVGWSPVAAFDLQPKKVAFAAPLQVTLPNLLQLQAAATFPVVRWDEAAMAWIGAGNATVGSDQATIALEISVAGQFAVIVPDAGAQLTPPADGALLAGLAPATVPQDTMALVLPQPKIIFYKPGVKSEVGTRLTVSGPPSGTPIWANIAEEYTFYTGQKLAGEPFKQDIVLYGFGKQGVPLAADYFISPTLDFAGQALNVGVLTVTAAVPTADGDTVAVVGIAGGTYSTVAGESLTIPPGAVSKYVPLSLSTLKLDESGITLPNGLDFVGGVTLSLAGQSLTNAAVLSVPVPAGFTPTGDLALARAVEVNGETRLAFVAAAVVDADRIVAKTDLLADGSVKSPGVLVEGRYLFVATKVRHGYAGGVVTGIDTAPFKGAVITDDSQPFAALSAVNGKYVIPVVVGPFILTALDPVKRDQGSAAGAATAGAYSAVDLAMQVEPPRVAATSPSAAARGVALAASVKITFSEPLSAASITQANFTLSAATGGVPCTLELSAGNTVVTMRHAEPFTPATVYTLQVQGVSDLAGYGMTAPYIATFVSLDTNPPPAPPAANLTATIPGIDGTTTVTGTQGTAGLHDTVVIINLTTGARNLVLLDPNGGFATVVQAGVKDRLQLEITSPAGVSTTVALPRFRQVHADGSISEAIGPEGGLVNGPGGIAVDVPSGAFKDGTVVTLKPIDEASFPVQLTQEDRVNFAFSGGISINLNGQVPAKYLNISIPAATSDTEDDRWVVTQVIQANGRDLLASVDTAKVINGRIATASPPCPGITSSGSFGFIKSARPLGVAYGSLGYSMPAGSVADVNSTGTVLPYGVDIGGFFNFCIPVFSTDVTVAYNTVNIVVKGTDIEDTVQEIVINNTTGQTGSRFARNALKYTFEIDGKSSDLARVYVKDLLDIESEILQVSQFAADSGKIGVQVGIDAFNLKNVKEIRVENFTNLLIPPVTYASSAVEMILPVEGGISDTFNNTQVSILSGAQPLVYGLRQSKAGPENLVVTVNPGTISLTRLGGTSNLKSIRILNNSNLVAAPLNVPLASLVNGGFESNFSGKLTDEYVLELAYDDSTLTQPFGKFTIRLKDPQGITVKTVSFPSPFKNMKTKIGVLNDIKDVPPVMDQVPLELLRNFKPGTDNLTFTFSEPIDESTLAGNVVIRDSSGTVVPVDLKVWVETVTVGGKSVDRYRLTILPKDALKMGETYTVTLSGVKDKGGNPFQYTDGSGNVGASLTMTLNTVSPNLVKSIPLNQSGKDVPLIDIALISKSPDITTLAAISDTSSGELLWRIMTFDVPKDPIKATMVGSGYGGGFKRRVHTIQGVDMKIKDTVAGCNANISGDPVNGYRFKGDVAVATAAVPAMQNSVAIYDVTDPAKVCQLGGRLLTADPGFLSDYNRPGTYHVSAYAQGITSVKDADGYKALIGVGEFAVMVVNLGDNIPEALPQARVKEGIFQGNHPEILTVGDNLVVFNRDVGQLEVLDMNFTQISALSFADADSATHLRYSGSIELDMNNSGTVKQFDLVFAYRPSSTTLNIINVANRLGPEISATVTLPENVRAVDFDRNNRKIIVAGSKTVYVLDFKSLNPVSIPVVWKYTYTDDRYIKCLKSDGTRGLFYVGTSKSLDVYDMVNGPNLYGVAEYIRFNPKAGVGLDYANPVRLKIRGAIVEMRDEATGNVLARTKTDPDGFYSFYAPYNQPLKLFVTAAFTDRKDFTPRLKVVNDAAPIKTWEAPTGGKNVTVTSKNTKRNLLADQVWDSAAKDYTVRDASPFAILDTIYSIESRIRMSDSGVVFPELIVEWSPTMAGSTAYYGDIKTLKINGDIKDDTDEYDTIIVGHEWFHYWQDKFARADSPGNEHKTGEKSDHRLAFDEGFVTAFSAIFTNDPINNPTYESHYYIDTGAAGVGCVNCRSLKNGSPAYKGFYDEHAIDELLWHLQDKASINLPFSDLYKAIKKQKTAKPFISIYSYMFDLARKHIDPTSTSWLSFGKPIVQLFDTKEIKLRVTEADEYEPFNPRFYNPVVIDAANPVVVNTFTREIGNAAVGCHYNVGDPLTTCSDNEPQVGPIGGGASYAWSYGFERGNKLLEKLFFKFKVTAAQANKDYTITANALSPLPVGATDPNWRIKYKLLHNGTVISDEGFKFGTASRKLKLLEGDYSLEISTVIFLYNAVDPSDGKNKDVFVYSPCRVSLTITP